MIEDDLYVGADTFILEGIVAGDMVAAGRIITIDGVVEGDLIVAAQTIVLNGQIADDVRAAGAAMRLGAGAVIGDDLIAFAYSLETEPGSAVGGDLLFAGSQALLAGSVDEDLIADVAGLALHGQVGGDVDASVGDPAAAAPVSPFVFMPEAPEVPAVPGGLTIGAEAEIGGDLIYESPVEADILAGVVAGTVVRQEPSVAEDAEEVVAGTLPWLLDHLRFLVALLALGLLMLWLVPGLARRSAVALEEQPWLSLGWGIATVILFFFLLLAIIAVVIILAILLDLITLGDLVGTTLAVGALVILALIVAFVLAVVYFSKIVISYEGGRWLLRRFNTGLADSRVWPLLLGALIFVILAAIPYLGWLINLIVILFGLGALLLAIRTRRPAVVEAA